MIGGRTNERNTKDNSEVGESTKLIKGIKKRDGMMMGWIRV
jgi:hypothetical protein